MNKKASEGGAMNSKGESGNIFTPEGVMMLFTAGFFDLMQLFVFIPIVGWLMTMATNLIAFLFFSLWSMMRKGGSGKIVRNKSAKKWVKRKKWIRPLAKVANLIPLLDYLTAPFPLWTLVVYLELAYED
jgi:hypothetical protein